ncbi:CvpA family protein [Neisseriaceae bacterium TC5R-5]|nr:CvpA family protein [Neisseriaceae bacterium TC5R-5]
MTLFDYIAIAIIVCSILVAMMRGLVAEVLSLSAWLIAFWSAKQFASLAVVFLPLTSFSEEGQWLGGFVAVFLLAWMVTVLLRLSLTSMMDSIGLGSINRLFGAVFGLARGLMVVTVLVLLAGLSDLPQKPMWRNAVLSEPFESVALASRPWLPTLLADKLRYTGQHNE